MLESLKISRRQSEIRQALAGLVGKEKPDESEVRAMSDLDKEYAVNEVKFRGALVVESEELAAAGRDLETRAGRQWDALVDNFQMRQIALAHDEGAPIVGETNEVVTELRSRGGFQGIPVPWRALSIERRAGETTSATVPDPVRHHEIIGQLFPSALASRMGGEIISIDHGTEAFPIATQGVSVGWQSTETGSVGAPQAFTTGDKLLKPDYTMGCQMVLTRRSLKQSGQGLEMAVRRDANSAMSAGLDAAIFNGIGSSGQPTGIVYGAPGNGVARTDVGVASTWSDFRDEVVDFLTASAANSPNEIRLALTPLVWGLLDATLYDSGSGISELDKLMRMMGAPVVSNVLPTGVALMTTSVGGVPPFVVGAFGAVDSVRDVYTQAASGSLVLTFLATLDVAVLRAAQTRVLDDLGS
jgi:hypothetical protein